MRVLICDPIAPPGLDRLHKEPDIDADVRLALSPETLMACIGHYDGLIVRSRTKVTAEMLGAAERLKVIGRAGIGVDNIDMAAATKAGIIVMISPEGNANAAAEHTLALLFALARHVSQADASLKRGEWTPARYVGVEPAGKVLGIIGLGRIGSLVAKKAQGLGVNTIAYDPFISRRRAQSIVVEILDLAEVLARADFLSIHTPKTRGTSHLIGPEAFPLMKRGVRLVNCARGGIVDEAALYEAICTGTVAGAALDVFEHEPPSHLPLVTHPSVICTPHLGASTAEAQERVSLDIAQQLIDYLKFGTIRNAVNGCHLDRKMRWKAEPSMSLVEKLGSFTANS